MNAIILSFLLFYLKNVQAVNNTYYPRYHLAPPKGWMNDPNGFSIFQGEYHLFYQYNPISSLEAGIAHWGHAKSKDLFHWEHLTIAMYPDQPYDNTGVFSGSAIVENNTLFLLYTGNARLDEENPDVVEQRQALAKTSDGIHVEKFENNPVILGEELQPNFRDPKVWKYNDTFYAVLGNSFNNNTLGRVLLFSSKDLVSWNQLSVLDYSDGSLGYMWECPDFFELDGYFVLLFSPQGIEPQGDKYRNLYEVGYIIGEFDYETLEFSPITEFRELDHGHDFYATQTIKDNSGRRILMAWVDMWEQNYPERVDGWTGHMSLPRKLSLGHDLGIIQTPVIEVETLKRRTLLHGKAKNGEQVELEDNAGEITIRADPRKNLRLILGSNNASSTVTVQFNAADSRVTLNRGGSDGVRRTKWKPKGELIWKIYVDASSIELFCGYGEVTFSSRFFPKGPVRLRLDDESYINELTVVSLSRSVPEPDGQ